MPTISAKQTQDRYETILCAARQVFIARGYQAASIGEIAALASISDGLIYRYFANKRDLLNKVLGDFYAVLILALETGISQQKGFTARLEALIRAHLGAFVAEPGLCRLFMSEIRTAADYNGSPPQALNRRYTSVLLRLVSEGIEAGEVRPDLDAKLLRDLLFGGIEHLVARHLADIEHFDANHYARETCTLLLQGALVVPTGAVNRAPLSDKAQAPQ